MALSGVVSHQNVATPQINFGNTKSKFCVDDKTCCSDASTAKMANLSKVAWNACISVSVLMWFFRVRFCSSLMHRFIMLRSHSADLLSSLAALVKEMDVATVPAARHNGQGKLPPLLVSAGCCPWRTKQRPAPRKLTAFFSFFTLTHHSRLCGQQQFLWNSWNSRNAFRFSTQ